MHTKDLAKAYRLVLEQGKSDNAYNVCSEQGVTVGGIAMARAKKFNLIKPPRVLAKKDVLSEQGDWALGPMLDQCMSAEKIMNELGWHPDYTSIVNMAAK